MAQPGLVVAITHPELRSVVVILLAATLGALLSRLSGRIVLPSVVLEIVLGVLIGPQALHVADVNSYTAVFADLGLAFIFFVAGIEVMEKRVARRLMGVGTMGWMMSLGLALLAGWLLEEAGLRASWWLVGMALCTTALGPLVPVLSDAGLLGTPLGSAVLGTGIAGEFWPIVFISIFLTGEYGAWLEVLLLLGFGAVVALTATIVLSARPPLLVNILQESVHTSGQTAVRASIFVLAALVLLAADAGFDFVLGAFAAGLVVGLVLDTPEGQDVKLRLEGIGFGFLIPIYFVTTGMNLDVDSLLRPSGVGLAVLFLALLLIVRGVSALLWRNALHPRETFGLALCAATGLPLIVAIVGIGGEHGSISSAAGASLIGAGFLSMLVYPLLATFLVSGSAARMEVDPSLERAEEDLIRRAPAD
jgi:Kef-type K+ transport system membrane component KefB